TANDTQRVVAGDAALRMKTGNNGAWIDQLGDGSPWPAPVWTYFAAAWNGEAFEVAGRTGMMVEGFRSEDGTGTLWVPADESPRHWLWEVARVGDQYLAVGDRATVMTSPNGVDWFEELIPSTLTNAVFLGVGGSTNLLVAVGNLGSVMVSRSSLTKVITTNEVVSFVNCLPVTNSVPVTNLVNLLGLVWEPVSPAPVAHTLQGVAERAGLVVVVGDAGTVLTTRDGRDWTLATIPGQPNLSSVAAAETGFVATGAAGAIFYSPDGASWSSRVSGTANWIYRVRHLEGQFVAVGQNGTLLTSPDAAVWTPRTSGSSAWLTDVTFTGSRYFATGTQGTVLTSVDAHDWEAVSVVTGKSLYGAASAGGQLVVVGVEGVILRALTDPRAPVNIAQFSQQECAEAGLSRLTFQGSVEQRFRLEYSDDLEHWNIIREFELLEPRLPFEYASEAKPVTGYRFFRTSLLGP
ncbi:MAG: WD40/YVTN/BNR-like repeat-containing protein, partial [Limisphaerales bacterium]